MRMCLTMAAVILGGMVFGSGRALASEPSCYGSAADAVAQAGARGVEGFRVETVRRDVFSGAVWATVRSCGHPERPAVLLMASVGSGVENGFDAGLARRNEAAAERALVMIAGSRVRLVQTDADVHLEMSGVAQSSGAIGDRVRVRLVPVSGDGGPDGSASSAERFATGIVRSRDVVEMEAR